MDENSEGYLLYAAIDLGTTFSGYAFALLEEFDEDKPLSILMNNNWGAVIGHSSYKCPTSVLIDENSKFMSFGYEAESEYADLKADEACFLFRHFKMLLYHSLNLSDKTEIASIDEKKTMYAVEIFAMAVSFLKNHLLDAVKGSQVKTLTKQDIKWVLTVPAIWTENAKSFMRKVAYKAGLIETENSKQLVIALEPEAASMFCHDIYKPVSGLKDGIKTGDKYIVVDAGGGTIDITAHEVLPFDKIKEISEPTGGDWGGTTVDRNFVGLLKKLFGAEFIDNFRQECSENWLNMMINFEKMKPDIKQSKNSLLLHLDYQFGESFSEATGTKIKEVLKGHSDLKFTNGAIRFNKEIIINLFSESINAIINCLKELFKKSHFDFILLVGGYSKSELLKDKIIEIFENTKGKNTKVIVPDEPQIAIAKGAVLFGYKPLYISSRIAQYSYGYNIQKIFQKGVHDRMYHFHHNGRDWCTDLFKMIIKKGDEVKPGTQITHEIGTDETYSTQLVLYRTLHPNATYAVGPYVEKLCSIIIKHEPPYNNLRKILEVTAEFGGTEIKVKAREKGTIRWWQTVTKFN